MDLNDIIPSGVKHITLLLLVYSGVVLFGGVFKD